MADEIPYWKRTVRVETVRRMLGGLDRECRARLLSGLGIEEYGLSKTDIHDVLTDWLLKQDQINETEGGGADGSE